MASPASPPSATMLEILKNCPRGKLSYERQSSYSPTKQERNSVISQILEKSSQSLNNSDSKNVTTPLAGSFADVSSVLEDVTIEMCDLQVQRLGMIFFKLWKK